MGQQIWTKLHVLKTNPPSTSTSRIWKHRTLVERGCRLVIWWKHNMQNLRKFVDKLTLLLALLSWGLRRNSLVCFCPPCLMSCSNTLAALLTRLHGASYFSNWNLQTADPYRNDQTRITTRWNWSHQSKWGECKDDRQQTLMNKKSIYGYSWCY